MKAEELRGKTADELKDELISLRKEAFNRWHKTFEAMQAAVSEVLDHLPNYRRELETLMTETFPILKKQDIPVAYREAS